MLDISPSTIPQSHVALFGMHPGPTWLSPPPSTSLHLHLHSVWLMLSSPSLFLCFFGSSDSFVFLRIRCRWSCIVTLWNITHTVHSLLHCCLMFYHHLYYVTITVTIPHLQLQSLTSCYTPASSYLCSACILSISRSTHSELLPIDHFFGYLLEATFPGPTPSLTSPIYPNQWIDLNQGVLGVGV